MKKIKLKKVILVIFTLISIAVIIKFIFFSYNLTYNNLKLVPKDCNNYIVINTKSIKKQITSYFFKYPATLLELNKNTENFKTEFGEIDFDLNEPISLYWDKITNITVINFSVNGSEKLDPVKFELLEVDYESDDVFINQKRNTIYYRDPSNNRVSVFFSDNEIFPKEVTTKYISKIIISDSSTYNTNVLKHFQTNPNSVIFNLENEFLENIGLTESSGEIKLETEQIYFNLKGSKSDRFIFKNSDTLKSFDDCWGNISGNLNTQKLMNLEISNELLDSSWNGVFSIGLKEIKNVGDLLKINQIEKLSNFFNFNLFLGNPSYSKDSIATEYGVLKYDSNFNGLILKDENSTSLKNSDNNFFNVSIDFEKMLEQKTNDFSWTSIRLILKKFNLKNFNVKCYPSNESEFMIEGKLKSIDSTKHIILSPFI